MRFKKYYKDILSLVSALLLLGTTILINKYDVKQLYREFAGLRLKVDAQEKVIEGLEDRVNVLVVQNQRLLFDLDKHNETRGSENALLIKKLQDLEYKVEVLSMKTTLSNGKVFNENTKIILHKKSLSLRNITKSFWSPLESLWKLWNVV